MAKGRKTGGRRPGTPNKTTAAARAVALAFLDRRTPEEIERLWAATVAESPKDALRMWLGAQEFVLPKLGRTEVEASGPGGGPLVVEVVTYTERKD